MTPLVLTRKIRSALYHTREGWKSWLLRQQVRKRRRTFKSWIKSLNADSPDVLVGANFVDFGGTRHHMHSLKRYSQLNISLVPSNKLLTVIDPGYFKVEFRKSFLQYEPEAVKAVHSHIFPWFIEWCHHQHKKLGTRWIHTHHNWYYPEFAVGELEPWQKEFNEGFLFALQNADVCLCVSRVEKDFLKNKFAIETEYLPNGVDVQICDSANPDRYRNKLGLDNFVLYVGRDDPVKNPKDFVRLAAALPNLQFVMIGHGLSTGILEDKWGMISPSNLIVKGAASHIEVQDAMAACSALVVTSKREGLPTLVLEAMTHGKPIVVPNEDGCMEAIDNGEYGFIYEQGDISDLAEKTENALADTKRCNRSRQRVLEEYDWRVIMQKLDRIYSKGRIK